MTINIHGKEYVTVAERVAEFHEKYSKGSITTECLSHEPVVMKAYVVPDTSVISRVFTGISAANPAKAIEKQSPYEVAETSAVGRALGFLGLGIVEGIASADEMHKAAIYAPDGGYATGKGRLKPTKATAGLDYRETVIKRLGMLVKDKFPTKDKLEASIKWLQEDNDPELVEEYLVPLQLKLEELNG